MLQVLRNICEHAGTRWLSRTICAVGTATTIWAIIYALYHYAWPICCGTASFFYGHWLWTSLGMGAMVLLTHAVTHADFGCSCTESHAYMPESTYYARPINPCRGSQYGSVYSASDCIRVDPDDRCFHIENCVSFDIGNSLVDPFPKRPPCPDVLSADRRVVPELRYKPCVVLDPEFDCFRPTDC